MIVTTTTTVSVPRFVIIRGTYEIGTLAAHGILQGAEYQGNNQGAGDEAILVDLHNSWSGDPDKEEKASFLVGRALQRWTRFEFHHHAQDAWAAL